MQMGTVWLEIPLPACWSLELRAGKGGEQCSVQREASTTAGISLSKYWISLGPDYSFL